MRLNKEQSKFIEIAWGRRVAFDVFKALFSESESTVRSRLRSLEENGFLSKTDKGWRTRRKKSLTVRPSKEELEAVGFSVTGEMAVMSKNGKIISYKCPENGQFGKLSIRGEGYFPIFTIETLIKRIEEI